MLKRILLASCVMVAASGAAFAGEQYVDETGFAISGYDPVAYFDLKQAEPGGAQPRAVPGRADITASYNVATWAFASEEHREMFVANPAKYAPKYDGHCLWHRTGGQGSGKPEPLADCRRGALSEHHADGGWFLGQRYQWEYQQVRR